MKKVQFGEMQDSLYSANRYIESLYEENTNHKKRRMMIQVAESGIYVFLTPKQQYCIENYYKREKSVQQIADEMGITKSAVYKHLKSAEKHLQKLTVLLPI